MKSETFVLKSDYISLCTLLKLTGLCRSGGEAKVHIANRLVTVNGSVETRKQNKIKAGQTVSFDGSHIEVVDGPN